jgi:signal peptidase I
MERTLGRATGVTRRILDALLLALIVVVLGGVALGKLLPLTGRQTIVIGGGSMEPAVPLGAAVVIRPVDAGALTAGDIISLKAGPQNALYTHRIVAVVDRADGRWVQTKGDANADEDPTLVPASAVVGRAEMVIPLAGYLIVLLSVPSGVLFLIGLAASLLAGAWLLESLEPDWVVKGTPRPVRAGRPFAGEPIAARPAVPAPAGGPAGVPFSRRPTVSEQLARSRETRARRARWGSIFPRRDDRPLP